MQWKMSILCNWKYESKKGEFVEVEKFKKIINKIIEYGILNRENSTLYLYNWGEPFLHPQFNDIINIINSENIKYGISTNLSILPKNIDYKKLIENLNVIMISMPGFSQESYNRIHGFNFLKVKENIMNIQQMLLSNGYKGKLQILFHIYQFNEKEIPIAEKFSREIGAEFIPYYAAINDWWLRKDYLENKLNIEKVKKMSNELFLSKLDEYINNSTRSGCTQHEEYFIIDEYGNVPTCCMLPNNHLDYSCGNILEDDIEDIIYNKVHKSVCSECIQDGLAIEESMVSRPEWYYELRDIYNNLGNVKFEFNYKIQSFSRKEINVDVLVRYIANIIKTNKLTEMEGINLFKKNYFYDYILLIQLASGLFENGLYIFAIAALKYALRLNKDDSILFNLGYISYEIGQYEEALKYLKEIQDKDIEIVELIKKATENINGLYN